MGIGEIKTRLKREKELRFINSRDVATSFEGSIFYAKDVEANEPLAKSLDEKLNSLSSSISPVINKANSYGYKNTRDKLSSVQSKTNTNFANQIIGDLKRVSQMFFDDYNQNYKSNLNIINPLIEIVEKYIKKYEKLDSEIESLRQEIRQAANQSTLNNTSSNTSYLESRKAGCETKQKQLISSCNEFLIKINSLNQKNQKLLADGLRRK